MGPLKDQRVPEQSTAEFTCELNIDTDDVKWFLDDDELSPSPSEGVVIMKKGKRHSLALEEVAPDDTGKVKVYAGSKLSEANLIVEEPPQSSSLHSKMSLSKR